MNKRITSETVGYKCQTSVLQEKVSDIFYWMSVRMTELSIEWGVPPTNVI